MIDRQFLDNGGYQELREFCGSKAKAIADQICIDQRIAQGVATIHRLSKKEEVKHE